MDLFVVERHGVETVASKEDEEAKLLKVMKRIEKRKRSRAKLKEKKEFQQKCIAERIKKKFKKAQIVKVPDVAEDEFIDKNLMSYESEKVPKDTEHKTESLEGYTVLGEEQSRKRPQVKRVLPKWLSNPTIISTNLKDVELRISDLKQLDKSLRKKLKANGICSFFPVQAAVIPWLLEAHRHADIVIPRDVCVSAPTGSGKTLAFVLPVIQALKQHTLKAIRALVVLPTQDLAKQVFKTFRKYTLGTSLDVCLVAGHTPFATEQKHLVVNNKGFGYLSKADILVCTAGRLVDHIKYTNGFSLKHLKFLVIDEADRVLENVQNDWLYHLEKHLDVTGTCNAGKVFNLITAKKSRMPQKLLFSATLSQDPEKLEKLSLFQPKLFACTEQTEHTETEENVPSHVVGRKYVTPVELTEKYITSSLNLKPLVLYQFIKSESLTKTLIFTHSAESSHRLAVLLKQLFENTLCIEEVSASLDGKLRSAVINRFSNDEIDILVCTDALARGMDFTGVQCVISYSAPKHIKTYIHRVGRTARAGESGLAVTLLHESQMVKFAKILQQIGKPNIEKVDISEDSLESLAKQYESALENLKQTIYDEEQNQLRKIKKIKKTVRRKRNHQGQLKNDVQE